MGVHKENPSDSAAFPSVRCRTLAIHEGALGDLILALPALEILAGQTGAVVDVCCRYRYGLLVHRLGLAHQWFSADDRVWATLHAGQPERRLSEILAQYYRVILFGFSQHLAEVLSRTTKGTVARVAPRPEPEDRTHVALHLVRGLRRRGIEGLSEYDESHIASWGRGKKGGGACGPDAHAVIHPGSGSRRKCWGLEGFLACGDRLQREGRKVTYLVGPADRFLAGELAARGARSGRVRMLDTIEDLLDLLDGAGAFIGNDSGVTHLAAWLGVPTVAIFGPSDPVRWQPLGGSVILLRTSLECLPCFETQPANCSDPRCLSGTSPESVLDALRKVEAFEPGQPRECVLAQT
ncbi:glycosyltransferase family 9 protein [Thermodesulfobacteriota bacterium]